MLMKKILALSVFFVVGLLIFSVIPGNASGDEKLKATYGWAGKILYIYATDKPVANEWKNYMEDKGYDVELLPVDGLLNAHYYQYDIIMIGNDTQGKWDESLARVIKMSRVPAIGIGLGGLEIFGDMGLSIRWGSSMVIDNAGDLYVPKKLTVYREPNDITAVPGIMSALSTGVKSYGIYGPILNSSLTTIYAYDSGFQQHAMIVQEDIYMYFGLNASPSIFTTEGDALFSNILHHLIYSFVTIFPTTRPITLDGINTGITEWFGQKRIGMGDNYTYLSEDGDYFYIYMRLKNSSSNDYMVSWFETTNNKTPGTDVGCFYVILSEYQHGVKVRRATGFSTTGNNWSLFEDPDGNNITAAWVFDSAVLTAEVRIKKSYMGIEPGKARHIGFGATVGPSLKSFPETFDWKNATSSTTLLSINHWLGYKENIYSAYMEGSPTMDGHVDDAEWACASWYYKYSPQENLSYIGFMHNESHIHLRAWMENTSGLDAIYLFFDTNSDGGSSPQTDDIEIWGGESPSGVFMNMHRGTGTGWGSTQAYPYRYAFGYSDSKLYLEMEIPFSILGITSGEYKDIKFGFLFSYNSGGDQAKVPYNLFYLNPDSWNMTLYPRDHWNTNKPGALDAPELVTSVTIDGTIVNFEWEDSFMYASTLSNGKGIWMMFKNDGTYLYIATKYYSPVPNSLTYVNFYFDVNYDHAGMPGNEDYFMRVRYDGTLQEFQGTGSGWQLVSRSGWSAYTNNVSNWWEIEMRIELSKFGISPGDNKDVGFMVMVNDYGKLQEYWPVADSSTSLLSYTRLTSSNNWGNPNEIPEINTAMIMVITLGIMAVSAIVRKRRL